MNDKLNITQTIRIYDDETLTYIAELEKTNFFKSRNGIICKSIELGLPLLYQQFFGKKISIEGNLAKSVDTETILKKLKELSLTLDDIFVLQNIIESLLSTVYNLKVAELVKTPVSEDEVRSGLLAFLPDNLQSVKDEIINRHQKKRN